MKIILAVALLALPAAAAAQVHPHAGEHAGEKVAPVRGADAIVKVNGLVCDFCVRALTKTFKKRSEVRDFAVDLDAKELRVAFAPGRSLDDATIRKLVIDAGYNVVGISRKAA